MSWNKWKTISIIITVCFYLPISLYINFWILKQLQPDRLIWFLWIINIPLLIVLQIITEIAKEE